MTIIMQQPYRLYKP